ncbi:MAG: hypothetical protein ACD_46C00032G0002 [uncultured bacterium]|nr:MAG: hypothetical protein ACD_46C00032G0002 [uncultured bacterium]
MLSQIRQHIIKNLWERYHVTTPHIKIIEEALARKNISPLALDHFAIIDLPGLHSGIPQLKDIFTLLGYETRGQGYLPDKQNDFVWLAEKNSAQQLADQVLPQVVVADFRLHELPSEIKKIIEKYAQQTQHSPQEEIRDFLTSLNDANVSKKIIDIILNYFCGRDWPLPTINEFRAVQEFNELLAWVLIFGRRPNHFTISVHLHPYFNDLEHFNEFIKTEAKLALNPDGGIIKGGKHTGIAQSSTLGISETVSLADGNIDIPTGFVEFVWRYSNVSNKPNLWSDYFTGFIATHANHVIESLYTEH